MALSNKNKKSKFGGQKNYLTDREDLDQSLNDFDPGDDENEDQNDSKIARIKNADLKRQNLERLTKTKF
jgi:hypothetical protein